MGLDMYFNARRFVWRKFDKNDEDRPDDVLANAVDEALGLGEDFPVTRIEVEVGYLRKANAIHGWLVDTFADGKDDCEPLFLEMEDFDKLKALIDPILELESAGKNSEAISLAEKTLPPTDGFFFGSDEVDQWYFDALKEMSKIIEKYRTLVERSNADGHNEWWDFIYQASW